MKNSEINPIIFSDHNPVSFSLVQESAPTPSSRWQLNTSLLADMDFNNSQEISPLILLEIAKAVHRGYIISYSTHKKKNEKEKQ